jgi:hypothetical protein
MRKPFLYAIALLTSIFVVMGAGQAKSIELFLAEGKSWPGRLIHYRDGVTEVILTRSDALPNDAVPRVQSVTLLSTGRTVLCSGLDRSLYELANGREFELHHGGYLARQVRTDTDGTLFWSGLETPRDTSPLPDGFIYCWDSATNAPRTLLTFSQGDVGHDWWGAFEVRDGKILVGTLRDRTRIYDVSVSPVRLVAVLPIAATAFRFDRDGALLACDGRGGLYRYPDFPNVEKQEEVLRTDIEFVDFAVVPAGTH